MNVTVTPSRFICADVMSHADLKELGDDEAVKKAGKLRQQVR